MENNNQEQKIKKTADMRKYRAEYKQKHKEAIKIKQREYYVNNKEKWTTMYIPKISVHILCDICKCSIVKKNMPVHKASKKHILNCEKLEIEALTAS